MYSAVLMMFLAAALIGALAIAVSFVLGPKRGGEGKLAAYESGIPAVGTARERFPIHFYIVAMLFIIFDVEAAFLFPLAVQFREEPVILFVQGGIFIAILAVGYVYILKKGVLNWK